jgi:hypothetical protein
MNIIKIMKGVFVSSRCLLLLLLIGYLDHFAGMMQNCSLLTQPNSSIALSKLSENFLPQNCGTVLSLPDKESDLTSLMNQTDTYSQTVTSNGIEDTRVDLHDYFSMNSTLLNTIVDETNRVSIESRTSVWLSMTQSNAMLMKAIVLMKLSILVCLYISLIKRLKASRTML